MRKAIMLRLMVEGVGKIKAVESTMVDASKVDLTPTFERVKRKHEDMRNQELMFGQLA